MSLEINWFDIELCGLCIINTHIITCSYKFIYIVQTRRLVNMHSHTYLLELQSLAQLLTTSLLMVGSLTLQLEEVLVFFLSFKTESCSLLGHILQLQVAQPKNKTNQCATSCTAVEQYNRKSPCAASWRSVQLEELNLTRQFTMR